MHRSLVKPAARNAAVAVSSAGFICGSLHDCERTSTRSPLTVTVDHSRWRLSLRSRSAARTRGFAASTGGGWAATGAGAVVTGAGECGTTTAGSAGVLAGSAFLPLPRNPKNSAMPAATTTATMIAAHGNPPPLSTAVPPASIEVRLIRPEPYGSAAWHFGHRT